MKIMVFGGTFDPVHKMHLKMCEVLKRAISADLVIVVPTFLPVHKDMGDKSASCEDRMNMCKIAFSDCENTIISDIEIKQQRPCYSYETLQRLKETYPDDDLYFACGSDMFMTLDKWKNADLLFSLATFCAVPRNVSVKEMKQYARSMESRGLKAVIVNMDADDISSSDFRDKNDFSLLDERVVKYIKDNGLYGVNDDR